MRQAYFLTNGRYTNTVAYAYDIAGRKATEGLLIADRTYTTGIEYNERSETSKYIYPDGTEIDQT